MAKMTSPIPERTQKSWEATPISPHHLVSGGARLDIASWPAPDPGKRLIVQGGTLIQRTFAERDATPPVGFKPYTDGKPETHEVYLVPFDNVDAMDNADIELLVPTKTMQIHENWLPNWAARPDEEKTMIRTLYHCIVGREVAI